MLRGLSDKFYFSKKDEITGNDNLMGLKISLNKQGTFELTSWVMVADFTGEILALELDPLNSNDVYSPAYADEMLNADEDRLDRIYLIDNDLNLIKFRLERECTILETVHLNKWKSIERFIEKNVIDKDFIRVSATDRCITIKGHTINHQTGYVWNWTCDNLESNENQQVLLSESIPFSHL